jgi:glycerophosphoryl diester phosphodiesterase
MAPLSIAHRGGAALRPENTLAAFADAIARGAGGAELDVQLTRDGHVVVVHDLRLNPDLCRDASGSWLDGPGGAVAQLTLEEIQTYDVGRPRPGSRYALEHPDLVVSDRERIPLLAEVVALARQAPTPFRLFVELKTSLADPAASANPETLAKATVAILKQADYLRQSVLVGFDWRCLTHAKTVDPDCVCWFSTRPQSWFAEGSPPAEDDPPAAPLLQVLRHWAHSATSPWAAGFDASKFSGSLVRAIKAAGGDGWFPWWRDATTTNIAEAHALGLKVGAWTVNDPAAMRSFARDRIDAICTDRPDLMP